MAGAAASHPLDVVKTRLQVQSGPKLSALAMGKSIYANDGVSRGLFKGLSASLLRQSVYSSVRFGTYDVLKGALATAPAAGAASSEPELSFVRKLVAGLTAGAVGATAGNPADVTMIRMQADGKLPAAERRNYKNVFDGLARIVREEGLLTLWKGSGPTVARAMLVTASQLVSYDVIKDALIGTGVFHDTTPTHLLSGFLAGFVASCTSTPADTVRVRLMSAKAGTYSGPVDCIVKTVRAEGPLALYKGFVPTFVRQAPYVVVMFLTLEQIKRFYRYVDAREELAATVQ